MDTGRPLALGPLLIEAPKVIVPVPLNLRTKSAPVVLVTLLLGPMSAVVIDVPVIPAPLVPVTLTLRMTLLLARVMPAPAALVIVGLAPLAARRVSAPTTRPSGWPMRRWLTSSGRPPV